LENNQPKYSLIEACLNEAGNQSSLSINNFTENIYSSGNIVCYHPKRKYCLMGITFGIEIFCKSELIKKNFGVNSHTLL